MVHHDMQVGLLTRGNVVKAALAMKKAGQKPV